jgi:hypothetical protein
LSYSLDLLILDRKSPEEGSCQAGTRFVAFSLFFLGSAFIYTKKKDFDESRLDFAILSPNPLKISSGEVVVLTNIGSFIRRF